LTDEGQQARSRAASGTSIEAGRVGRAHGLDGSFYVTGPRRLLLGTGTPVTLAGRSARIVRRAGTDARPIVRVEGIEGREAAERLRGQPLLVDAVDAPALGPGEWWAHELEGCRVVDGERDVGVVRRLIELPSCDALEVRREGAAELLVPLVRDAIRSIDAAAGRIDVDLEFLGEAP
jgi:16S rRNA processing protein RimM